MQNPTAIDMRPDINLAMALAASKPTGPAVEALVARLKNHIEALADPAQTYAESLGDQRARDIAEQTIRHARGLVRDTGGDPAATLRLLAKSVEYLSRYAHATQAAAGQAGSRR